MEYLIIRMMLKFDGNNIVNKDICTPEKFVTILRITKPERAAGP